MTPCLRFLTILCTALFSTTINSFSQNILPSDLTASLNSEISKGIVRKMDEIQARFSAKMDEIGKWSSDKLTKAAKSNDSLGAYLKDIKYNPDIKSIKVPGKIPALDSIEKLCSFISRLQVNGNATLSPVNDVVAKLQQAYAKGLATMSSLKRQKAILDGFNTSGKYENLKNEYERKIAECRNRLEALMANAVMEKLKDGMLKVTSALLASISQKIPSLSIAGLPALNSPNPFANAPPFAISTPNYTGIPTRSAILGNVAGLSQQSVSQVQAMVSNAATAQSGFSGLQNPLKKKKGKASNSLKGVPFSKRIEKALDLQTVKLNRYIPLISDFGLQAGYKLNKRSSAGIGGSLKMGWGQDIRSIKLTVSGLSYRSYVRWKFGKEDSNWFVSGGYERNYLTAQPVILRNINLGSKWSTSALLGLQKQYKISPKWKGNMQVYFDFMSLGKSSVNQPLVFRMGWGL